MSGFLVDYACPCQDDMLSYRAFVGPLLAQRILLSTVLSIEGNAPDCKNRRFVQAGTPLGMGRWRDVGFADVWLLRREGKQ